MTTISYVSVPMTDSTGKVTRVVRVPLADFSTLITMNGINLKAVDTTLGAVALD